MTKIISAQDAIKLGKFIIYRDEEYAMYPGGMYGEALEYGNGEGCLSYGKGASFGAGTGYENDEWLND